jgi:hypothetical protein
MTAIRVLVVLSMGLPSMLLTGCETGTGVGPPGKSPVSTKIEFASRYHIEKAIMTVFLAEGFQPIGQLPGRTLFERAGGSTMQANYGDWFGEGTLVRAEVVLTEVEFGTHLVTCDVSMQEGGAWIPVSNGRARFSTLVKRVKKLAVVL